MKGKIKEFRPSSWSIDNKTSIYVLALVISIFGIMNYISIPKEQFPEIVVPTMFVSTIYPGTSPADIENLITRPIEKNIKSINGVKKITSKSVQDYSMIVVEFNTNVNVADAKQKVKDAVDKSRVDLPNNLPKDPDVKEIDMSEIPIMYINLSGDYDLSKLKSYAEILQDRIESLKEITRVDIVGALDREIQINADMYKMQVADVTTSDIQRAVASENITISGGSVDLVGMKRAIRIVGEFKDIETLQNLVFKSSSGATVYLKDIAEIKDDFKERESFARLNNKNVITLNIVKKSGENLIEASDKIKEIIKDEQEKNFPSKLKIDITGDMSHFTKNTLNELNNTIIIGFILVTIILMFFMGFTNAFFVGLSVPLSMAIAYNIMPGIDFTMNMLVMFAFIFALGIVVDDAIVVIENTHRIFKLNNGKLSIKRAAKIATGEVFVPILSGTLTTLAPFIPLAFWPGIVGKFMYFIPVTLIITLLASLFVAYIINPVFAVQFMKHEDDIEDAPIDKKKITRASIVMASIALLAYLFGSFGIGNFMLLVILLYLYHNFWGYKTIIHFQNKMIPWYMKLYERALAYVLRKRRPFYFLSGTFALLVITFIIVGIAKPKVQFFPANQPNYIYAYIKMPVGTSVQYTDSITRIVEKKIYGVIGNNNPIVESVISNVALGASDPYERDASVASNKSKVTVAFVEFSKRHGENTTDYLDKIRQAVKGIPGTEIAVEPNKSGPPTGRALNVELLGENIDTLYKTSKSFMKYLDSLNIPGIEELKSDFDDNKPELLIDIDRERANREGISTGQIGGEIRTAVFGTEISKYRDGEDQYPIQLRYGEEQRKNIDALLNLKITYRDMNSGILRQIPLSSVAKLTYVNNYGGINRKNLKRVISIYSNVLSDYTANEVVASVTRAIKGFTPPAGVDIQITGEQENQQESMDFLSKAMILALCLIFFILITQFNSVSKPLIIISEVLFSLIGVLLGFVIFGIPISIVMTGIGVVALAGIVVRNGILLVEFTDVLKSRGLKTREAIIEAGKTRITPVLLTASATIIGLVPLAIGFNINFITMFTEFSPQIHFGGENVQFFGALAWTIIFGLSFATFLTLLLVPAMYLIAYQLKVRVKRKKSNRLYRKNLPYKKEDSDEDPENLIL
jgi:multidrug efflux pump